MSKKNILLFLIIICLLFIVIIWFKHKDTNNSSQFTDAPEAKELVPAKEVITELSINRKDIISSDIEKILNLAYSDYTSFGGNISDYFSNYTDGYEIDFGTISNVNSLVNDSLYESVDFFDANGELIESIDNLPNIIYNNKEIEISENTSELKNGSYYIIRYFDNFSIYTPYFIVYLSNNNFKVGDVWVVSSNESYYNFDAELQY